MLSDLRYRLRAIFRSRVMERELDSELQQHYEREVEKAVAAGIPLAEAQRQARLAMGGIEQLKEECRDARGVSPFDSTLRDVRYAARQLRRRPGFSLAVIVSLALGIGANTAIFTLIDAVLLRSLPVRDPQGLWFVVRHQPATTTYGYGYNEFRKLRDASPVFSDIAAYGSTRVAVSIGGSSEPTAEAQMVSGNFFSALGVRAAAGRTLQPQDDERPNGHPVAMLSYNYWQRRFALDPGVVGRTLSLAGTPFTIVGVTAPEFFGLEVGRSADLFVPVMMQPTVMPSSENWLTESTVRSFWLTVVARLGADRSPQQATAIVAGLDVLDPLMTKPTAPGQQPERIPERLGLVPATTGLSTLRQQFSTPLFILMLVVATVLLIACANVGSLALSQAAARTPEFSMRLALGAGSWRLVRQLLIEHLLLASIGGVLGLALARWATGVLVAFMSSGRAPIALNLSPDPRVLAFTAAVSIFTGILCGLAPTLRLRHVDVITGLRHQLRGAGASDWLRSGRLLVAGQVALCLVLLFGAGLFVRSLRHVDAGDGGFDREHLLVIRVEPRGSDQRGVPGASQRLDATYRDLIQRVESLHGVRSATMAHFAPTVDIGYAEPVRLPSGEVRRIRKQMTYPSYFRTMGLAMRDGRDFEEKDLSSESPPVGIVNEAFVREVMNGENPRGKLIADSRGGVREVIGVVQDSKYANLKSATPPLMYQPFLQTQTGRGQMTLHVRIAADSPDVAARIRQEVQRIDASMPLLALETLAVQVDGALSRERLVATLSTLFGLLALVLAGVGLYGLMSFSILGRTGEIGIRMALGAERGMVLRLILREALLLVVAGLAIGMPAALLAGWLSASQISGLIYGVSATDPLTLGGAIVMLLSVAGVAAYLPAARAARIDPLVALRNE